MSYNIGVNVIETDGKSAPAIVGAPTSVAGFVVLTRRGPTGDAVRVSSFQQFVERFGGHHPGFYGAYCVEGFFLNGGREAYIARMKGRDGSAASMDNLCIYESKSKLKITAGYRGDEDKGEWGNSLSVRIFSKPLVSIKLAANLNGCTHGRIESVEHKAPINLSGPPNGSTWSFKVTVDESPLYAVEINIKDLRRPESVSLEEVASRIRSKVGDKAVVLVRNDKLAIISRSSEVNSKIALDALDTSDILSKLGFNDESATSVACSEYTDQYSEVAVASVSGFKEGNWIRLHDGIKTMFRKISCIDRDNKLLKWDPETTNPK
ncbi:MAG: hypothetical protein V2B18_01460, partial [Pseudomonadota bacterium]